MNIQALILDLDNTIFPVPSIGDELFQPFFELLEQRQDYEGDLQEIRKDAMRIPYQKVAEKYKFSEALKDKGDSILQQLTYSKHIPAFEDYAVLKQLPFAKFLVTTGYTNMQQSKIDCLGIAPDFTELHVVDPTKTDKTKKGVFQSILERYKYKPTEVLVIGDDPHSELKAGRELGIRTVLYTKQNNSSSYASCTISSFEELKELL
ncbi:HAD family hydrolase [Pontibacter mangrovi]|uniref:HAD family hydrolase n=1 Tax=Pontibacter mangrovi TaxID=2589816 RepID=A0A501W7K2_9BACT|nr:HAD family hydrolase [Pontibacter mangrovi]TPE45913.1 HAD family hydrolase [Pontibacter mangrovi]